MKFDLSNEFDVNKAKTYFNTLLSKQKQVEVKEVRKKRTLSQNAYLHVCITLFAIEFGYTLYEAKILLKRESSFMIYEKNDVLFLKQTRNMDSSELTKFVEFIRNYSAGLGCYIPSSEEYLTNRMQIDRQIQQHEQYL